MNTTNPNSAFLGTRDNTGLSIRTNNTERMLIASTGKIGIGEAISNYALVGLLTIRNGWSDWLTLKPDVAGDLNSAWHLHNPQTQDRLLFYHTNSDGSYTQDQFSLWNDGKVSIGTTNTPGDYGLYVYKGILTDKVRVAVHGSGQWADHVLNPGYRLMPLDEIQRFIAENGHLPGVPSAECMVEEGMDVLQTNAMLMEKVEELTLHMMNLNERLKTIEHENAVLKQQLLR